MEEHYYQEYRLRIIGWKTNLPASEHYTSKDMPKHEQEEVSVVLENFWSPICFTVYIPGGKATYFRYTKNECVLSHCVSRFRVYDTERTSMQTPEFVGVMLIDDANDEFDIRDRWLIMRKFTDSAVTVCADKPVTVEGKSILLLQKEDDETKVALLYDPDGSYECMLNRREPFRQYSGKE